MIRGLDLQHAKAVLEYGPGSGVFTDAILPRLGKDTKYLPIELNEEMVAAFKKRHPNVPLVHDSVENARKICDDHGIDQVDYIICGLPWASFPEALQVRILEGVTKVLKPGGTLVTFGYHVGTLMPAGKRFARLLPRYFSSMSRTPVIWRNIPPAFVLRGTR
ncbi:MAG: methyltransferase domain-containing protein [Phycisphaerae bacterium]|nr:methyltransferase domain-containing protein [Phycisphaerae bacterium]